MKITDIKQSDLPLWVLSDNRRSFIGFIIKHASGNYNHFMEMRKLTHFASQNFNGFKEVLTKTLEDLEGDVAKFIEHVAAKMALSRGIVDGCYSVELCDRCCKSPLTKRLMEADLY